MEEVEKSDQINNSILPDFARNLSIKKKQKASQLGAESTSQSLDSIFSFVIPEFAKDIIELETRKSRFIDAFHQMKYFIEHTMKMSNFFTTEEVLEKQFIFPVSPKSLNNQIIVAVDGSFVRKSYTNFEFSLFRAISVIYSFSAKGIDIGYYPVENGIENYQLTRILNNTSDQIASSQISIDRAFMEISLINDMITKYKNNIDMVILDGSILTEPLNLLSSESQHKELMVKYSKLVKEYKKLYNLCDLRKIDLVGVVKDTRSSTFRKLLSRRIPQILPKLNEPSLLKIDYKKLLPYFSDLDFFHRVLDIGERSCVFSISSSGNSWIPRQLEILNKELKSKTSFLDEYQFFASYMKPAPFDYPIRIEFHQNKKNINPAGIHSKIQRICETLYPLSSKFDDFAVPIPQIEAHMRAKLSLADLNMVIQYLTQQIGEELNSFTKKILFDDLDKQYGRKFDEFLMKNNFMVPKRRERMPLG